MTDVLAITVQQPYAEWIIDGRKDIENRTWRTPHRGLLAIHAGRKTYELDGLGLDRDGYVMGAVIGTVELVDIVRGSESEWAMGDHWHWVLANPQRLAVPVPARGKMGLFTVELP